MAGSLMKSWPAVSVPPPAVPVPFDPRSDGQFFSPASLPATWPAIACAKMMYGVMTRFVGSTGNFGSGPPVPG